MRPPRTRLRRGPCLDDDDDDFIKGALIGAVLGVVVNNMITNNGN